VSEPRADRREAIAGLGAESVVGPEDDLSAAVASATDGNGVDVAFDAAGAGAAVQQAIASLTPQGTLLIVALHEQEFGFNPTPFVFAENTMVGSIAYRPEDFDAVIQAMAEGKYNFEGWVTEVPLREVDDALRDLRSGRGIKVLVRS
jgi:(R,R)-butanediol dehydrogenase / meso-butanediol dehydrogenase / diacetyl reductase